MTNPERETKQQRTIDKLFTRQKSETSINDPQVIHAASLFREWGFMDYITARILLTKALEPTQSKVPTKAQSLEDLIKAHSRAQHEEMTKNLEVGYSLLPACAAAATSVEKYFKAIVTLKEKKLTQYSHLEKNLINAAGNSVKNFFKVINKDFVKYLRKCYELRYFDNMNQEMALDISLRMVLGELDFSIAEMEKTIHITLNGFEIPDSYRSFCQLKAPSLWCHNYVLLGLDKEEFLKQQDLRLSIISDPTKGLRVEWSSPKKSIVDKQFFVNAFHPITTRSNKSTVSSSQTLLKVEAAIMHYSSKAQEENKTS